MLLTSKWDFYICAICTEWARCKAHTHARTHAHAHTYKPNDAICSRKWLVSWPREGGSRGGGGREGKGKKRKDEEEEEV